MSYPKHFREDVNKTCAAKNLAVVSKCLAIVLVPKSGTGAVGTSGRVSESNAVEDQDAADQTVVDPSDGNVIQSSEVRKALSPGGYSGKELLQDFKLRNKTCYWNPSLVESIKCLECKGFVEPCTILVTAPDIHLENLRSAWARRVLKAPAGFVIERIGDVSSIEMQVIPQTQFIPLPDALCSIIMELNSQRMVATLESISDKLTAWSRDVRVPSQQLVFDMLSNLIQERKVFHTGSGYFVVTPDTGRLQNNTSSGFLPTNASWLPYHPMYIPVFQGQAGQPSLLLPPTRASNMRSISCQVTTIEESSEDEKTQKDQDKIIKASSDHKSSRSNSLRRKDGKDADAKTSRSNSLRRKEDTKFSRDGPGERITIEETGELKRSASLKIKGEKTKATKLPNQKVESIVPVKEKEEKRSIFSKLFNRKKKNKAKDKILMPPPLPPPPSSRAPSVVSGSGAASDGKADKEYGTFSAQFPPPEWVWYHQQLEKQKRTESWVTQQSNKPTQQPSLPAKTTSRPPTGHRHNPASDYSHPVCGKPQHRAQQPSVLERMSVNGLGHSQDQVIVNDGARKYGQHEEMVNPHLTRTGHVYESFRNPAGVRSHHHHRKSRDFENGGEDKKHQFAPSEYAVIDHGETTALQESGVYRSVSALSPVAHLSDESMYAKLAEQHKLGPRHSTPRYEGDIEHPAYRTDASDHHHHPQRRKSHRTHRKPQRLYSYYEGQGDDISYEYKGRLPNKNSSRAQSRDSGVNCVGLAGGEKTQKQAAAVYENAPNNVHLHNTQHQNQRQPTGITSAALVQYSTNETSPTTNFTTTDSLVNYCDTTNAAYNSVVYGSHVTDICGVSSVLHNTIASSNCDSCHIPLPQNSLASTFYQDGVGDFSPPHLLICKGDINPKVTHDVLELHRSPETTDSIGSAPEAGGRVASAARGLSEKVSALNKEMEQASKSVKLNAADDCEYEQKIQQDRLTAPGTNLCDVQNSNPDFNKGPQHEWQLGNIEQHHPISGDAQITETQSQEEDIATGTQFSSTASVDVRDPTFLNSVKALVAADSGHGLGVLDSGFNSPRNPELLAQRRCQPSNQSNSASETSEEQHHLLNSGSGREDLHPRGDNQTPQSSTNGSSDQHSHSDVYMVTGSEHHSGSTNDTDSLAPDQEVKPAPEATLAARIKHSGSQNSLRSQSYLPQSQSYNCLQQTQRLPQQHAHPHPSHLPYSMPAPLNHNLVPHYQHTAKLVPYPDVYNNNTGGSTPSVVYVDQNYPFLLSYPPPHSQSHQKLPHHKPPKRERPRSVDLWKQQAPSQLHRFQEEQLTRKYGANGEYEVMGVL